MTHCNPLSFPAKTIGIDLGDRISAFTIRDAAGEVTERGKLPTTRIACHEFFSLHPGARVVYEVGTHSPWLTWLLRELGHETVVANPWRFKLISQSVTKSDAKDADLLSDFGYLKPSTLSPITHRGPEVNAARAVITARSTLVRARTKLINCVRGLVKSIGERIPASSTESFHKKLWLPDSLRPALEPLREQIRMLTEQIRDFDKHIERLGREQYPETGRLRQICGVGPITALSFVCLIEDPNRFSNSREVGSYLGLVPKLRQSGNRDPQLRITKAGDRTTRALLVQCAQYILGPFGKDCDLRRFGLRLAERGGNAAKKRAVIAVARKLAVLLHALWVSGEDYEPLRAATKTQPRTRKAG